jgi:glycosyltransferase involved in cell wall biosynthesis
VVIPSYKQARFLPQAIESVLAQTTRDVEAVILDDGSPDNTSDIAKRYPSVCCLRQGNKGVAEARNAGFGASRGQFIIFLDADDRLTPRAVESHLLCFEAHPEAGFVVGDIDHISTDGSYVYSPRWPALEKNHYEELLRANHVANTMAVMFRRSTLEGIGGFDQRCEPAEDYEILLRAAGLVASAHHHTVVAQYRRHETNTSRKGATMLRAMDYVMKSQRDRVHGNPRLESAWRQGKVYWLDHFGAVAIKEIYRDFSRRDFSQAAHAFATLAWHLRGRLAILPWKHRRKALRAVRRRLGG